MEQWVRCLEVCRGLCYQRLVTQFEGISLRFVRLHEWNSSDISLVLICVVIIMFESFMLEVKA